MAEARAALVARLARVLDLELAAARALADCLAAEATALATSPDAVAAAAAAKLAEVYQLERLAAERSEVAVALDIGDARTATWDALIEGIGEPLLATSWQQLRTALLHCREANLRNGALVDQCQRQVRSALEILTGQTSGPQLYGADGTRDAEARPRSLAKA
jgi:flagellar biosynthesis/type III secretory pathway chaperone